MSTLLRLKTLLARDYPLQQDALTESARLEDLGIDSLGVMDLLFAIEDEFRITVPPERVPLSTLADLVRYVDELVASQHGAASVPPSAGSPAGGA